MCARRRATDDEDSRLRGQLRRAATPALLELVIEHGVRFGMSELRQVLLNPFVSPEVIDELASNRRLTSTYEVRRALASHRRTPEVHSMRFINGLFWRDLMTIALDTRLRAPVRQLAEKYLLQRFDRLTIGEMIALARRAPSATASRLLMTGEPRVLRAVLGNGRLRSEAVLAALANHQMPPRSLDVIAEDRRFGRLYDVRLALCRHVNVPFRVVLRLLPTLRRNDLATILNIDGHSTVVLNRARDLLEPDLAGPNAEKGADAVADAICFGDNRD